MSRMTKEVLRDITVTLVDKGLWEPSLWLLLIAEIEACWKEIEELKDIITNHGDDLLKAKKSGWDDCERYYTAHREKEGGG